MRKFFYLLLLLLLPVILYGQTVDTRFGKNRVQYKKFRWKNLSFRNFEVYYYGENLQLAEIAGRLGEENIFTLTDVIGYTPYSKIKLIVYSSIEDYQQANIGIYDPEYVSGGHTNFIKSRVELAFRGNLNDFENDLKKGLSYTLLSTMFYGGNFREVLQNSYFLSLPEWFLKGAAAFIAEGWSEESKSNLNFLLNSGELKDPSRYQGKQAEIVGQSLWNYFFVKYGEKEFRSLLIYVRSVKNFESAFEASTSLDYSEFIENWQNYYTDEFSKIKKSFDPMPDTSKIVNKNHPLPSFSVSSTGRIAYTINNQSRYKIKLQKSSSENFKNYQKGGQKLLSRRENAQIPLVKFTDNGLLASIYNRRGSYYFKLEDLGSKQSIVKKIPRLNNIRKFDISSDGNQVLISGSEKGQSDLFLYFHKTNLLKEVTSDVYDEYDATFTDKGKLAFSSDQNIENPDSSGKDIQLFLKDLNSKKAAQVIPILGISRKSKFAGNNLYFLNNRSGIYNLYKYSLQTGQIRQVTNYPVSIQDFEIDKNGKTFLVKFQNGRTEQIYKLTDLPEKDLIINDSLQLYQQVAKNYDSTIIAKPDSAIAEREIDINNYQFESETGSKEDLHYLGPYNYTNPLSIENVNSYLQVDPLRGLGIIMEAIMSDYLENHKVYAGIFALTDLKSSNLYGEYQYLAKRTDFRLRYERKSLARSTEISSDKYFLNKIEASAQYPIDVTKRISITPFLATTRYNPVYFLSVALPDSSTFYYGSEGSFVFDNTISKGLNIQRGTKFKASFEYYLSPKSSNNFGKLYVDLRNYLPLYKNITLATRFSGGQFMGNAPKNFLLGGMDNWLFNQKMIRFDANDPLYPAVFKNQSDLLFTPFVAPMRGFIYNEQYGQKYFLINGEIRVPLAGTLYGGESVTKFFKNLQFISFTDFGIAWTGKNPFSRDNSFNTKIINDNSSPFSAIVVNYKDPFLLGYGMGLRTMILGYFVKADMAWGVIDRKVVQKRYYITLGFDF